MSKTDKPKNELNIGFILISSEKFIQFFIIMLVAEKFIFIEYHLTNQLIKFNQSIY